MKKEFNLDVLSLTEDLDSVFEAHGVGQAAQIGWAAALLAAAFDSPNWVEAWGDIPPTMDWIKEVAKRASFGMKTSVHAQQEGLYEN